MPTLLQINSVVNSGSTGRIAEEIGLTVMNNGWQSYIAYGRNERPSNSELVKIGTELDIKLHGLLTRLFDKHGYGSKNATVQLIKKIREINPNIIHLHNIHGYYLNIGVLFEYLSEINIPVVWTFHDCWPITGHCSYFDYIKCYKWKKQCYECPQVRKYPSSILFDNSRSNYRYKKMHFTSLRNLTIVPVSDWLSGIVSESFLSKYQVRRIFNGIDLDLFRPSSSFVKRNKLGIDSKFMILGVASTWCERKGLADFLKLSKLIACDEIIVLIGLNRKQIDILPNNIIGLERTENIQQLVELYSESDVVLNLSVEETFGMTTVEGFACGTPGIVYNCTASPELISPETGFIIEQGDLTGVISAINIIKEKGKAHYANACRERAVKLYNKDDRYNEYLELYNQLLKNKGTNI